MKEVLLEVQKRNSSGTHFSRRIRKTGFIPAILYGGKEKQQLLQIKEGDFNRVIHSAAGENVIINLKFIDEKNQPLQEKSKTVIIKEIQKDPVKRNIIHVDLCQISLREKLKVNVPIVAVGEVLGVKEGGVLGYIQREVEIECLPTQIPEKIEVDVSNLKIGDSFYVKDLIIKDIDILTSPDRVLITVTPPTILEEKVAEAVPTPEIVEPEVIGKGKKEKEEGEEEAAPKEKEQAPKVEKSEQK